MRRIGEFVAKGIDHDPKQMRFVTWTLKYNRCHWLELLSLGKHYERGEFRASVTDENMDVSTTANLTRFAIALLSLTAVAVSEQPRSHTKGTPTGKPTGPLKPRVIRCTLGGMFMGIGFSLAPGAFDGLTLLGQPLLLPFAWVVMAASYVTVILGVVYLRSGLGSWITTRRS